MTSTGQLLTPKELEAIARRLSRTSNPAEAARIRQRLTRGFYGI